MSTSASVPTPGINLAVLAGTLSRAPETRSLPSGTTVVDLQVRIRPPEGEAESVPVAWFDPPPAAAGWSPGDPVVVVGRVRRRFFRAGGVTASRTEVVATTVLPTGRRAGVRKAVVAALDPVRATLAP